MNGLLAPIALLLLALLSMPEQGFAISAPRCHTPDLQVEWASGGVALGHVSSVVALHNAGQAACTFYGYPGIGLLGDQGELLSMPIVWGGPSYMFPGGLAPPQSVVVAPGESASFDLATDDVSVGGAASEQLCELASSVEVIPPDEFDFLVLSGPYQSCNRVSVSPVVAGVNGPPSSPPGAD
jgi:Protein of unknown function (DUF4232)